MLTATIELEQEDVNPEDHLESKLNPSLLLRGDSQSSVATDPNNLHSEERLRNATADNRKSLISLPLSSGWGFNRQQQQQQHQRQEQPSQPARPLIRLKRRYRDKENSSVGPEEATQDKVSAESEKPSSPPVKKRSFFEIVEEDIQRRLKKSKPRKRKVCLSLVAAGYPKEKKQKQQKQQKQTQQKEEQEDIVEVAVEESIPCTPPVFEEEPAEVVNRGDSCSSLLSGRSRHSSSQQIDWEQVEAISVEDSEEEKPPVKKKEEESPVKSVFDFDSLFEDTPPPVKVPTRTYPGCSSSRLTLSKNFLQQQQQQQQQLNGPQSSAVVERESAKDKLVGGGGGDDMSIRLHNLPSSYNNSVSSTTSANYQQEVRASASSVVLLAAAAASTGGEPQTMSSHPHYTRSKINSMQGRFALSNATDMAIAASLNDSKVNSLQGRVDTGTATELAIAQSLSEDQQNILNSVVAPVIAPLNPAAVANMNNSLATLCNIGNSCYLNSVLYTLRFAPNFIHNLHHLIEDTDSVYQRLNQNKLKSSSLGRNISGLHGPSGRSWSSKDLASLGGSTASTNSSSSIGSGSTTSTAAMNGTSGTGSIGGGSGGLPMASREENLPPKTNRQVVTEQLHELFQSLHRSEANETMEPFHAGNILRAVQDVSSTFEGNQQQDAHEFLMCVLDSVRESCQSLIKTITDHPDVLISARPPVPECIEPFPPEPKSGAGRFFRRRKESVKTTKPTTNGGSSGATTLPKAAVSGGGGGGDASDPLANLKHALFAKTSSAADEQLVRERLQALGLDFFRDDFEGVTVAKTKCLTCETCTEQKETMIDIAIPIASSDVFEAADINPQLFYQNSCITREYFRGDNKYRCEECCGYREAIRSISFEVLPRQLILQLKRFNGDMEKINSYIPTPFVLRCFCNTCLPKPDCDKPHIYRLYSVITHVGARMSVGHYIAYTSSLDVHAEYLGCGKDRRKHLFLSGGSLDGLAGSAASGGGGGAGSAGSGSAKSNSEKGTSGHLKKLFSAKKAFSAGDMTKKTKNIVGNKMNLINGMEGLNLINGSSTGSSNTIPFGSHSGSNSPNSNGTPTGAGGSLTSRFPCAGLKCCGIHLKNSHLSLYGSGSCDSSSAAAASAETNGGTPLMGSAADSSNSGSTSSVAESRMNYINSMASDLSSGTASANLALFEQSLSQQMWHMCDDDKIKIMSQVEFEDLLSPNRRHVITPYLLFYARYDVAPASGSRQRDAEAAGLRKADGGGMDGSSMMID